MPKSTEPISLLEHSMILNKLKCVKKNQIDAKNAAQTKTGQNLHCPFTRVFTAWETVQNISKPFFHDSYTTEGKSEVYDK